MLSDKRIRKNKENLGTELKEARQKEGYTQKALASALGLEYYTMVSQMELGYISIPPALWVPLAKTLRMETEVWCLRCLKEYQPDVYEALFHNRSIRESGAVLKLYLRGTLDTLLEESLNKKKDSRPN